LPPSAPAKPDKTLLVLSQVYVPDPASVGQHMHDAAAEMARRGYDVLVLTSRRGYDDPSQKYRWRETRDGVHIRRLPFSSFGKKSIAVRLIAGCIFVLQCIFIGLFTRHLAGILVSTSPPICPIAAVVVGRLRRVPIKHWAMDLNPDQMIALGNISETSPQARMFDWLNRLILRHAHDVIALDRFMADRLCRKLDVREKIHVMPPWPHQDHLEVVDHADNPFRREHALEGKFVIMHSGNHSLAHPLATILDAALRLQEEKRLIFMFVGGGVGKREVEAVIAEHKPTNIVSLPYQPLTQIRYSLSAADVHLVAMGDPIVGICHPCKVYGAMALGRPVLLLGPAPSHISDIIDESHIGWQIRHGDVDGAVTTIRQILHSDPEQLAALGAAAAQTVSRKFAKSILCNRFCDVLERGVRPIDSSSTGGDRV